MKREFSTGRVILVCVAALFVITLYRSADEIFVWNNGDAVAQIAAIAAACAFRLALCALLCEAARRLFSLDGSVAFSFRAKPATLSLGAICGAFAQLAAAAIAALIEGSPTFGVCAVPEDAPAWAAFFSTVAVTPFCEELVFRGAIYRTLRKIVPLKTNFEFSVAFSGVVFSVIHVQTDGPVPRFTPAVIAALVCGALLAVTVERRGSLAPAVAFHAAFNLTSFFAGYIPLPPVAAAAIFTPLFLGAIILLIIKPKGNDNEAL